MSVGPVQGPGGVSDLLEALRSGRVQGGEEARLRAAAQLMEGQFYQELFKAMRDTIPEDGLMSGGQGEDMFTDLLDQQYADAAAVQSERGLGEALYRYFVKSIEGTEAVDPEAPATMHDISAVRGDDARLHAMDEESRSFAIERPETTSFKVTRGS